MTLIGQRSFTFTMSGVTDRENAVVEAWLKEIVEVAEAEGPQHILSDGVPRFLKLGHKMLPDYSFGALAMLALHVLGEVEDALELNASAGGHT